MGFVNGGEFNKLKIMKNLNEQAFVTFFPPLVAFLLRATGEFFSAASFLLNLNWVSRLKRENSKNVFMQNFFQPNHFRVTSKFNIKYITR